MTRGAKSDTSDWSSELAHLIDPDAMANIVAGVSDIAVVITRDGVIRDAYPSPDFAAVPRLIGWRGRHIQDLLNYESIPKFENRLAEFLAGSGQARPIQVNHIGTDGGPEFPIRYSLHPTSQSDAILLLGRDMTQDAEVQQQLVSAQIALEKDYEAQREQDLRFRVLMEAIDTPIVFVSVKTGRIAACNAAADTLFGRARDGTINTALDAEFEDGRQRDLVDRLVATASDPAGTPVSVTRTGRGEHMTIAPTLYRGADGQMLLCKLQKASVRATAADPLQSHLTGLFRNGADAIVFITATGEIISVNDAFLGLADVTHAAGVKGRPIADFFGRGVVDLNVILQNLRRTGTLRLYATQLVSEHGAQRGIEVSATRIDASDAVVYALVIRDTRRADAARTPMQQVTDVDQASVSELIGGHSLKDIVARTTDVVEKMCIEAAVEITSNNRVAAAEMLGLSRQSLYVKLRKYGLVERT